MLLVERGSCADMLAESQCAETSCCQTFTDPSTSCEVPARQGPCFCDGLCFERGDCCDDINDIPIILSCVPCEIKDKCCFVCILVVSICVHWYWVYVFVSLCCWEGGYIGLCANLHVTIKLKG